MNTSALKKSNECAATARVTSTKSMYSVIPRTTECAWPSTVKEENMLSRLEFCSDYKQQIDWKLRDVPFVKLVRSDALDLSKQY